MPLLKQLIANHFLQLYNFFQENSGVFGYSITDLTSTHQEKTLSRKPPPSQGIRKTTKEYASEWHHRIKCCSLSQRFSFDKEG